MKIIIIYLLKLFKVNYVDDYEIPCKSAKEIFFVIATFCIILLSF